MKRTDHRRTQRDRISKHKGLRLVGDAGLVGKKNVLAVPRDGIVVVSDEVTAVERVTFFQVVVNASEDLVFTVLLEIPYVSLPQGSVETGTNFSTLSAAPLNDSGEIWLPTKGPFNVTALAWQAVEANVVKSPASICAVGTMVVVVGGLERSIVPW